MKYFIFLILFSMIILSPHFVEAQSSFKCPDGAYYGKDNQGNNACRDIETNKIVKEIQTTQTEQKSEIPQSKRTDPCQNPFSPECITLPSTNFSDNSIILMGVVAIVIVSVIVGIVASKKKKTSSGMKPIDYSHDTTTPSTPSNNDRMMWTCSSCRQKFTDRQSYISHPCHFR